MSIIGKITAIGESQFGIFIDFRQIDPGDGRDGDSLFRRNLWRNGGGLDDAARDAFANERIVEIFFTDDYVMGINFIDRKDARLPEFIYRERDGI